MIVDIQGDNSEFHNFYDKESNRRWIDVVNHLGHDGLREKVPDFQGLSGTFPTFPGDFPDFCRGMEADGSPLAPVRPAAAARGGSLW